jgi:imidazolonepropionase-like amidohydrolase
VIRSIGGAWARFVLIAAGIFLFTAPWGRAADDEVLVLRHVTAFIGEDLRPEADQVIELKAGKIEKIMAAADYVAPPGAQVLDLTGKFVLPGFIDMHAHLLAHPWDKEGRLMPQADRAASERILRLLLAHGITTVRDPGSPMQAAVDLRKMVSEGKVVGPRIFTAGSIINSSPFNPEPFYPVTTAAEIRDEIANQARLGVDWVKIYGSMPPDFAKVAIEEAHGRGLLITGHLGRTNWTQAAELKIDMVEHASSWSWDYVEPKLREHPAERGLMDRVAWLERVDLAGEPIRAMAKALAENHVTVDPTLIAMHTKFWGNDARYTRHPKMNLMPEIFAAGWPKGSFTADFTANDYARAQKAWPKMLAHTKLLFEAGVRLVVGADTPTPWIISGVSFHEEMKLLNDAGIPVADVLKMATVNGTRALGLKAPEGTIASGARADLVVLDQDPSRPIENANAIHLVIQGGRIFRPSELLSE